jgi:Domain of unknown function (DUF4398)
MTSGALTSTPAVFRCDGSERCCYVDPEFVFEEQGNNVAHGRITFVAGLACVVLAACAAAPERPAAELSRAQALVQTAEQQGAQEFAGAELERARGKLTQAEALADEGEGEQSLRLAQQAAIDAEVAAAKAAAGKSRKAADELDRSIETLRNEAARSQPPSPP